MKYLYILGASGSGKTTLALNLELNDFENFSKVLQHTTRPPREGEINGIDYRFITDEKFEKMATRKSTGYREFFETVENQFLPYKYGGSYRELHDEKWNVVVACIEGFLSGVNDASLVIDDIVLLNIITNGNSFVEREGRDASTEEKYNLSVLAPFKRKVLSEDWLYINDVQIPYYEITVDELRKMSSKEIVEFARKICQI